MEDPAMSEPEHPDPAGSDPAPAEPGLPVDEVIAALEDYQRRTLDLYDRHRDDPEVCVKALVSLHLEWTEEDPERARTVARHRNAVMAGPGRDRLTAANARYFSATREWLTAEPVAGRLRGLPFNVMHGLVFAPTQELAKLWLSGKLRGRPTAYADRMGRAAWAGILAAREPAGHEETEA